MLEQHTREPGVVALPRTDLIPLVQFYTIQLSQLQDGGLSLNIAATLCEEDGELLLMDMACLRVADLAEALALIESGVVFPASLLH